mgnify:FL=1
MSTPFTPTLPSRRIETLDFLRGFALLGILMVNMPLMNYPITSILAQTKHYTGFTDVLAMNFIKVFFESKFYALFSLLFGYGFWLFISRPAGNSTAIPLFRRRVFLLLLFGLGHVVLLWAGDILVFYALFGFLILWFRKSPDRKLFRWALGFLLVPVVLNLLMYLLTLLASLHPEAKAGMENGMAEQAAALNATIADAIRIYSSGTYAESVSMRLQEYSMMLPGILFFYPNVLAFFLLGMVAARRRYLQEPENHFPLFRSGLKWGLIIGIPGNLLYALAFSQSPPNQASEWSLVVSVCSAFAAPALTLAYVSGLVLLWQQGKMQEGFRLLAGVGKMALSHYLMQSLITSFLFLNWGLGLYGKVGVAQGILITLAIFLTQAGISRVWLKKFRYGPMEWLWRSLTYGKIQSLRLQNEGS